MIIYSRCCNHYYHLKPLPPFDLLAGDERSRSAYDLWSSYSVSFLRFSTLSRRLRLILICSSVCTKTSSSLFRSRFCYSRTLICCWSAAISSLRPLFLSVRPALENLTSSFSLRVIAIWSSLARILASRSKITAWSSFPRRSSASLYLKRAIFSSLPLSRFLWETELSDDCLAFWSLSILSSAWAASTASVVLLSSNSLYSAIFERSTALSLALANS